MKLLPRFFHEEFSDIFITQPNQAFTPRQILEQFARNEIVPTMNTSSDILDDEHFNEDDLLSDSVITFDDDIEAQSHLDENQYQPYEENKGHDPVPGNSPENSSTEIEGTQQEN